MSDPKDHEHEHSHGHGHHHDHDDPFHARPDEPLNLEKLDPASRSLAEALRLSFGALKVIMVLLVVYFAFSGAFEIGEGEVGVRMHLGARTPEVYEPGIYLAWPDPIDRVIRVSTRPRQVPIQRSFWMRIQDGQEEAPLDQITARQSLRPDLDGSLVTADKNLVHGQWSVNYRVRPEDATLFVANVSPSTDMREQRQAADHIVGVAAERAIVHAVAQVNADDFVRQGPSNDQIRMLIQQKLDELRAGIEVEEVSLSRRTAPLRVRPAFQEVSGAESEKAQRIDNARREASRILNRVAGSVHEELVEAIEAYEQARHAEDDAAVAEADRQIEVLLERATGEVSGVLQDAHTYRRELVSRVQSEANLFEQLLPVYQENPNIVLQRLWQNVRQEVLSGDVETLYLPSQADKHLYLEINRDPAVQRRRERERHREQVRQQQQGEHDH